MRTVFIYILAFFVICLQCDATLSVTDITQLHTNSVMEWTYTVATLKTKKSHSEYGIVGIPFYASSTSRYVSEDCVNVISYPVLSTTAKEFFAAQSYTGMNAYCSLPWSTLSNNETSESSVRFVPTKDHVFGQIGSHYEWRGYLNDISFYLQGVDVTGIQHHNNKNGSSIMGQIINFYISLHIEVNGWIVTSDGIFEEVEGHIWFDREWETPLLPNMVATLGTVTSQVTYSPIISAYDRALAIKSASSRGWIWSGLNYFNRTDEKRYFMMWQLTRNAQGVQVYFDFNGFELMTEGGVNQYLSHAPAVVINEVWTSPANITYPIALDITFNGWGKLSYKPVQKDQVFTGKTHMWEGLSMITTNRHDMSDINGYLELAQYKVNN